MKRRAQILTLLILYGISGIFLPAYHVLGHASDEAYKGASEVESGPSASWADAGEAGCSTYGDHYDHPGLTTHVHCAACKSLQAGSQGTALGSVVRAEALSGYVSRTLLRAAPQPCRGAAASRAPPA